MDNFRNIIKKRRSFLTGDGDIPELILEEWEKAASSHPLAGYTWESKDRTILDCILFSYKKALTLAKLYNIEKSKFYRNPQILTKIEDTLNFLNENFYNEYAEEKFNWWHWEIGYPLVLHDILVLMSDYLPHSLTKKYLKTTTYFQSDPRYSGNNPVAIHPARNPFRISTGGNRVDTVKISLIRSALEKSFDELALSLKAIRDVWKYSDPIEKRRGEEKDGFYEDGSFIQHSSIPYTGTYGNVLLGGVAEILYLIELENMKQFYEIILKTFEPLFFKGAFPDMVNGRAITRGKSDHFHGHNILNSLALIAENAEEPYKQKFLDIVSRELKLDTFYNHLENEKNPFYYNLILKFLEDHIEEIYKSNIAHFHNMDRVFKRTESYALGIAMHSDKIGNYERMNGENMSGWFTSDGAYYLYHGNLDNYHDYWTQMDFHYIPGTTEVHMEMVGIDSQRNEESSYIPVSSRKGAFEGEYGAFGMNFLNWNERLSSKKSWFLIPGGVIFIESDICGKGDIYTTIENKKIYDISSIKIDSKILKTNFSKGYFKEIEADGRLYRINENKEIYVLIEKKDRNFFLKIWIEHGCNPTAETLFWELILDKNTYHSEISDFKYSINSEIHLIESKKFKIFNNWEKNCFKILLKN